MRSRCIFARVLLTSAFAASTAIGVFAQAATPKPAPAVPQRGQAPASPQRGAAPAAAAPAERFIAIGCIAREAGTAGAAARYTITDKRGDKPSVYRLQGDPKELEIHAGHTVEISGPLSAQSASGRGANAALVLKVDKLTWISTTCPK